MAKKTSLFIGIILLIDLFPTGSQGQGLGSPFITNYSPDQYSGGAQNWCLQQDNRGVMLIGNSQGIIEYDGISWRATPMPNKSAVRSISIDDEGLIYIGAKNDLGYLSYDSVNNTQFISLKNKLDSTYHNFNDVWDIFITNHGIYFCTYDYIFKWESQKFKAILPVSGFHRAFLVNDMIYVRDRENGLFKVENDELIPVPAGKRFEEESIYFMLPISNRDILIGTRQKGLLLYDGETFKPYYVEYHDRLIEEQLYTALILSNDNLAIGTLRDGLFIYSKTGKLLQKFDKKSGLDNQTVTAMLTDNQGALWLALNSGLSRIELSSPFTFFGEESGINGIITSIADHNGHLYIGTIQELSVFRNPDGYSSGLNDNPHVFEAINSIATQVWHLLVAKDVLLAATSEGIYQIKNNNVALISEGLTFFLHQSKTDLNRVYAGLGNGASSIYYDGNEWKFEKSIEEIDVEIRTIAEAEPGKLWFGTAQSGVISYDESNSTASKYDNNQGLPDGYTHVFELKEEILFGTASGIYSSKLINNEFHNQDKFGERFNDGLREVSGIFPANDSLFVISSFNNKTEINYGNLDADNGVSWNDNVFQRAPEMSIYGTYHDPKGVTWLGGTLGLLRFDHNVSHNDKNPYSTLLRAVYINSDSSLFMGGTREVAIPILSYKNNNLRFEYSATSYDLPDRNVFSYKLEGFDESWSEWSSEYKKDYTNVPEGFYTFKVKSKNVYSQEGSIASYQFEISPPWQRTWYAYLLYSFIFLGFVIGAIKLNVRRLKMANVELENIVKLRTSQLAMKNHKLSEQQKRIIDQNEELADALEDLKMQKEEITAQRDEIERGQRIIADKNQQLEEVNHSLEQKVKERTEELFKTYEDLLKSHKELDEFIYRSSHDLKGPLVTLLGLCQLGKIEAKEETSRNYFEKLEQSAISMNLMLERLIKTREIKGATIAKNELKLKSRIDEIFDFTHKDIRPEKMIFQNEVDEDLTVTTDVALADMLFRIVIENAIKYRDDLKSVSYLKVSALSNGNSIKIEFEDNGVGIEPGIEQRIFEMFFVGNEQKHGAGLGLYEAKLIAEKLDGTINLSNSINGSTIFEIELPV